MHKKIEQIKRKLTGLQAIINEMRCKNKDCPKVDEGLLKADTMITAAKSYLNVAKKQLIN